MRDNKRLKSGRKTHYWCSQDKDRKKKAKASEVPGVKHRDNLGMNRFECRSRLVISCRAGAAANTRMVTIRINHHENHRPYYDVAMPPAAVQIIRESLEWSTPVSLVPKIQAIHPHVSANQIHRAWTEMSETLWKRDPVQLLSTEMLVKEHHEDVDLFEIEQREGVVQLCWGMKKIASRLRGKVVEIAIDATCESQIDFKTGSSPDG